MARSGCQFSCIDYSKGVVGKEEVFFFQAEDGIRDGHVTGVQTCALPICNKGFRGAIGAGQYSASAACAAAQAAISARMQIGRASCRERGQISEGVGSRNRNILR